jgi:uncharacterized membrane protein
MSTQWWIGLVSSFLASGVEVVEAVTIVLAAGVTRGWRSTWIGVVCAALCLAAIVAALGPALRTLIPIDALRLVVGTLLLIFGLQWLRKAIMRYTGLKAIHDEEKIYEREIGELSARPLRGVQGPGSRVQTPKPQVVSSVEGPKSELAASDSGLWTPASGPERSDAGMDWTAFTVAFKGVLLEGLEVVFIVVTFALSTGDLTPPLLGSIAAAVIVTGVAVVVHRPLSRVPENTLKFAVGVMLTAFGTFWGAEGVGLQWPGEDLAILALVAFYGISSGVVIGLLRLRQPTGGKAVSQA